LSASFAISLQPLGVLQACALCYQIFQARNIRIEIATHNIDVQSQARISYIQTNVDLLCIYPTVMILKPFLLNSLILLNLDY
jgi:hypothetical protein